MLIIDGYMGKSKKLVEILKEKETSYANTIILDSVGVSELPYFGETYSVPSVSIEEDTIGNFLEMKLFKNPHFKYVVLELNASRNLINHFKTLELKLNRELILTIQCPAEESQEPIKVYEV